MSAKHCVLVIDQGTTSSRAIVFDQGPGIVSVAQLELPQIYPDDGWVEHDPESIWNTVLSVSRQAFRDAEERGYRVVAIGITNQRETTVVWDRSTGEVIYNAINWQDRRTSGMCRDLREQNLEPSIQAKTGLLLDPYFSATKLSWILNHVEGARQKADKGELAFGTVDCFLLWRLTSGQSHTTDATNASRTSLYNIHTGIWDRELLDIFQIPESMLPEVFDCEALFGETDSAIFGRSIPVTGVAGDQQAASIGQCCFEQGDIKSTYGTGCFVLVNSGDTALVSKNRMLTTVAYQIDGKTTYALEGSIFMAGAAVQWLRDGLGIIKSSAETEKMAESMDSNAGVYLVPAFTGLGVPYWEPDVRGAIFGLTRATGRKEIVRATLESICYQTADLFTALAKDGIAPKTLRVDGGMVANNWLLQFLANILDMEVCRPEILETTALGAAYLAGGKIGLYGSFEELAKHWCPETEFSPKLGSEEREKLLSGWHDAVGRVISPGSH